jgi:hypothetical protein
VIGKGPLSCVRPPASVRDISRDWQPHLISHSKPLTSRYDAPRPPSTAEPRRMRRWRLWIWRIFLPARSAVSRRWDVREELLQRPQPSRMQKRLLATPHRSTRRRPHVSFRMPWSISSTQPVEIGLCAGRAEPCEPLLQSAAPSVGTKMVKA